MKVLVIGSGGREHALAWAIKKSPQLTELFVAPGNAGTAAIAENVPISAEDIDSLVAFVQMNDIDLTVVGPEAPLVAGIVDRLRANGRRCFGPAQAAAQLEGSKVFSKRFMRKHGIPTGDFSVFANAEAAKRHLYQSIMPIVIKADGLAAGKGVIVAQSLKEAERAIDDIMVDRKFGGAGASVVIEECLVGEEVSVHAICGGEDAVLLPPSQDHKRAFDNDEGPNTGGMGAYAPVPFVSDDTRAMILQRVITPTLKGMAKDGSPFTGVLYAGLMMTEDGPKVLEYNVRFGDPETQVLLPLLKTDLLAVLDEAAGGSLPDDIELYEDRAAATVVVAAEGYPGSYPKGKAIAPLDGVETSSRVVFHAGTAVTDGGLVTSGGRVLAVTAWGPHLADAIHVAYEGVEQVSFEGAFYRKDIGRKAL